MLKTKIHSKNRRLKKAEVKEYIDDPGTRLHEEHTRFFFEDYGTGHVKQDLVYELNNGDFVFVFDPNGHSIPGKGNYYEKESFLRMIRWNRKVNDDYTYGRASSVDHWKFYSKQGTQLTTGESVHMNLISKELNIHVTELNFSYHSLGKIDTEIEKLSYGKAWEILYDALVYYVGEVILRRVDGKWENNISPAGDEYPYVTVANSDLHYMPVNIVWQEISGLNLCNLRKATADEIRTNAIWHPKNNKSNR